MSKVFLTGLCPLPFENTRKSYGPGIRTWQMAHALASAGHRVRLVCMRIGGTYSSEDTIPDRETVEGVDIERVDPEDFFAAGGLDRHFAEFAPDLVVGATIYGSYVLAQAEPDLPFWADQFGHVMAEAQAKAHLEQENWPLAHFWNLLRPVLCTADRISVVSERQRWAAVGELGTVGRLGAETCGYEFTSVMPCALLPPKSVEIRPMLRGSAYPDDAFVALWSGGYNVWSDVDTLFQALEWAMDREPSLHFVSTGGGIDGHDVSTYQRFEDAVAASKHRDRYHLRGWVLAEEVPSYQAEGDLGVLCEVPMYEGLLGSKNRVVQWLGGGLPVLYNRVGDLGDLLATRDLGLTFEVQDAAAMGQHLVWAASHRDTLSSMADRARDYALSELTFEATTGGLVAWADDPAKAPDAAIRSLRQTPESFSAAALADAAEEEVAGVVEAEVAPEAADGAPESGLYDERPSAGVVSASGGAARLADETASGAVAAVDEVQIPRALPETSSGEVARGNLQSSPLTSFLRRIFSSSY